MWVYHVSHHQLNSHHLPKTIHILNIVRYHAVGSLTSMCVYHVSHHQCSLSSSSVKVTRLCFSRSRRYIRREKKGCTVLSLPPTRHSTGIFCEKNGQICFTKQQKAKRKTINLWNDGNDKRQNRKADLGAVCTTKHSWATSSSMLLYVHRDHKDGGRRMVTSAFHTAPELCFIEFNAAFRSQRHTD